MEFGITPKMCTFVATRFTNWLRDSWMILPFIYIIHMDSMKSNQIKSIDLIRMCLGLLYVGIPCEWSTATHWHRFDNNLHTQKQVATIYFDSFQCCDATATIFKSLTHSFACRANWIGFSVFTSLFHALCFISLLAALNKLEAYVWTACRRMQNHSILKCDSHRP